MTTCNNFDIIHHEIMRGVIDKIDHWYNRMCMEFRYRRVVVHRLLILYVWNIAY